MSPGPPPFLSLPRPARVLVCTVVGAAIVALAAAELAVRVEFDLLPFAVCFGVCILGSFFEVRAPGGYWLQPHLPAFVAAAALLPPVAVAAVAVATFVPGALHRREQWYRPLFNASTFALAGAVAGVITHTVASPDVAGDEVLALFAGALTLVAINHVLLSAVSALARGDRPRDGVAAALRLRETLGAGLFYDVALALTGASLAALWHSYPQALPLAAGPAALACASLWVPMLRHASRTDAKTGLFNYAHVRHLMQVAIEDAQRSGAPASVLMVDLDHLRHLNNRHGHLAGDAVIAAVAAILAEHTRGRGSAGRFGGEEFCAVLPGLTTTAAAEVAEDVRAHVEALQLGLGTDEGPASTVSIGVATFPVHGEDVDAVLHAADMALYDAKLGGRNRVRVAPPNGVKLPPAPASAPRLDEAPGPVLNAVALADQDEAESTRRAWVAPYALLLVSVTLAIAALCDTGAIEREPVLFAALLASVLGLDALRIDLFERLRTSPAAMPVLALAALFGPLGPVAGEALILGSRLLRRHAPVQAGFDFGALALAGIAAAGVFDVAADAGMDEIAAGVVAGVAYYAVNMPLLAVVIALWQGTRPIDNFREQLAWLLPHYAAFGALAGVFVEAWERTGFNVFLLFGLPTVVLWVAEQQYLQRSRTGVAELRGSHAELEAANEHLRRLLRDNTALVSRLQQSYLSTITSLARTIEAKDPYTGGHTERVARVATELGRQLGFDDEELRAVEVGAVIHDIGKIGVPDTTLLKAGPLSAAEREEIERHPEISSYIVAELDIPTIVKQMVRSHHERYDGQGYPDGLAGEEIPLAARILTVADALDAMTSDRPYRRARPLHEAIAAIEAHAGSQFCPSVVAALRTCTGAGTTVPAERLSVVP